MNITLRVWRQKGPEEKGALHEYHLREVSEDASFLEMLDILNEQLFAAGEEPVAFDSDCREGICGMCGVVINGVPHGPHQDRTTTCQLHMRTFKDGDTIGGYISVNTGAAPEAHSVPVPKVDADRAFEAAACIGCGACAAACPNGSAMLFTAAKITHLGLLPQGKPENLDRVVNMLNQHDAEGFGPCQNIGECARVCPKQVPLETISFMNRQLGKAFLKGK